MTDNTINATSRTDVECTTCDWLYPSAEHTGPGTADRPDNADYVDQALPHIGAHIDTTGHQVRVTITTFATDETSSLLVGPRPIKERTRGAARLPAHTFPALPDPERPAQDAEAVATMRCPDCKAEPGKPCVWRGPGRLGVHANRWSRRWRRPARRTTGGTR